MPIYEYRCKPCRHDFETLVRGHGDTPHCPKCGGIELLKQFSVPAAAHTGSSASQGSLPLCGDTGPDLGCGPGHCGSGMCSFDD